MAGNNSPRLAPRYIENVQITAREVQERLQKYNSLRVLILGKSGVGKSSLVNALFGYSKVAKVGVIKPETSSVQEYDLKLGDVTIKIFDTPGFVSGERKSNKKCLQNIRDVCKCADVIFLCFRMDGHSKDLEEPLNLLARSFDKKSKFWSKTMVVFTMANRVIPAGRHRRRTGDDYNDFIFGEFKGAVKAILEKKSIVIEENQFVRAGNPDVLDEGGERLANHSKFDDSKEWTPDFLIQCFKSECWSEDAKATLLRANWRKFRTTAVSAAGVAPVLEGAGIAMIVVGAGASVAGPMGLPLTVTLCVAGSALCISGIVAAKVSTASAHQVHSTKKKTKEYVAQVHEDSRRSTGADNDPQPESGGTNAIPMVPMGQ